MCSNLNSLMQRQPWDSGHTTLKRHDAVKFHYGPSVREPLHAVFWDHELFFNWGRVSWSMAAMSLSQHISLPKAMCGWLEKSWYSNSVRRDSLGKQRGTNPISTLQWPFLKHALVFPRCFKQRCHTSGLLNFCSFLWHSSKLGGGVASLLLPESPTGSLLWGASLGPMLWSVPDASGVWKECGGYAGALIERGQDEAGSHISWRWFPFLVFCCHVSWCLCFMNLVETVWSSAGEQAALRFRSGSLPHLCWVFNGLFYSMRRNFNRNL